MANERKSTPAVPVSGSVAGFSPEDLQALQEISRIAAKTSGIQLQERHYPMVASRLNGRFSELGVSSLAEYLVYYRAHEVEESPRLVGLLTTHHTYFFREFSHFEYLLDHALPQLIPLVRARSDKRLRVWSAACSRGQEAYSLAMFLELHLKRLAPDLSYEIFGTDVDPECVEIAKNGVYPRKDLEEVPLTLLGNHWARGTGEIAEFVKAKRSLRDPCRFKEGNLLGLSAPKAGDSERFDVIFCRNVFIYFNAQQIAKIAAELLNRMSDAGYLFIGISETFSGLSLPVTSFGPSIYRRRAAAEARGPVRSEAEKPATPTLLKVFCVDDSPTILSLLKRILVPEKGFEVVGTAINGLDAAVKLVGLAPDVMTLDIHMPEQDGIEYLKKSLRPGHPPVVMLTSVSREDMSLAGKALELGAADFVEKPALSNLQERGEEIRNKLKAAARAHRGGIKAEPLAQKSFASPIREAEAGGARVVVVPWNQRARGWKLAGELRDRRFRTVLWVDREDLSADQLAEAVRKESGAHFTCEPLSNLKDSSGVGVVAGGAVEFAGLSRLHASAAGTSILVLGEIDPSWARRIETLTGAQVLLEDLGGGRGTSSLQGQASDIVPASSFSYLSAAFLASPRKKVA